MLSETLKLLFNRDLNQLKVEIESYKKESTIWLVEEGIANSAGNLCLHLVGNLNFFIGTEIGKTGYIRHRDLEFSLKDVPRAELIKKIEDTIPVIDTALDMITDEQLETTYPKEVFGHPMSKRYHHPPHLIQKGCHLSLPQPHLKQYSCQNCPRCLN